MQSSFKTRLSVVLGLTAIYVLLHSVLYSVISHAVIAFSIIPLICAAVLIGRYGGLIAGIIAFPLNTALPSLSQPGLDIFPMMGRYFWAAHIVLVLLGFGGGYLNELRIRLKKELAARDQMTAELTLAMEKAEAANSAKSGFLAQMSHEIRTPMNGIIGMIDLLLETDLAFEQKDYATSVQITANSLLEVLNDILDFSKIEAGKLDLEIIDFDLQVTLENLSDIFAIKTATKDIGFALLIDSDVPTLLKADPGRLRQILFNLGGNAIKFVETGEVSIHVSLLKDTGTIASLRFEVIDTGIGIPQDRLDRLFKSFSQVDASTTRKYGGTGLGLSISKQLTDLMGGKIGVNSELGKGTTFWFTLDLEKQLEDRTPKIEIQENIQQQKILVVDDNPTHHKIFTEYLKSWGCRVNSVEDGQKALSILTQAAKENDPFQAAVVDMRIPDMSGEDLGKEIKADPQLKQTILIMATAYGQRGDANRLEKVGFSAFLTKPVKKNHLFECLRMALAASGTSENDSERRIITRYTIEENKSIQPVPEKSPAEAAKEDDAKPSWRILLAEDNLMNQKVAGKMLSKMGHTVVIANNGREAVEVFQQEQLDLILMDGQMPEMSGLEATAEIRKLEAGQSHIPIIAATAAALIGDRQRFLDGGMDGYISKPLDRKKLEEVITKVILG